MFLGQGSGSASRSAGGPLPVSGRSGYTALAPCPAPAVRAPRGALFGHTGIDPETVGYLHYDPDGAGTTEQDPTRRVTAVARRDTTCHSMTAVTLSELHEHGLNRLVKAWSKPGQRLVNAWSMPGQSLVKAWSMPGQCLVKAWSKLGQCLVRA
jgi:hypothetical protein